MPLTETAVPPVPPEERPPEIAFETRYAATEVLVTWQGAVRAPSRVTRTEADAKALADAVYARASQGEALEDLARSMSDGGAGPRGGKLGTFLTGTLVPDVESAVARLEVGGISPPVRTPFGYHVLRRDAVQQAHLAQVFVSWQGARRSPATRTKEEARQRIEEAKARIATGSPFADVAASLSDSTAGTPPSGDLGWVVPGQMVAAFDDHAFVLTPGATSDVFETPYGFHVLMRLE